MSKDIRSFFQPKKPAKTVVIEDDDDVIPESPDVQIKNKKKLSRKKRCLSDSDDEIFETKKKKTDRTKTNSKASNSKNNKTPNKTELKEVKVSDLFGNNKIKRSEPLVKKVKKTETGIHSDDEFEKSLLEVDAIEELAIKEIEKEKQGKNCEKIKEQTKNITEDSKSKINTDKELETEKQGKNCEKIKEQTENIIEDSKSKINTNKEKKSNDAKEKSPKKLNGDSHSQETKDQKIRDNHETKEDKKHESPYKKRSDAISSVFGKKHESKDKKPDDSKKLETGEKPAKEKKRDFSEFVQSDVSFADSSEHDDDKHKSKKKKMDKSLNESALTDEERHERKMHSAALYQKYLNRSGPKHLGAKEIPEGAPNCLANCAFLLTGVLDSFERDEVAAAITKYGGTVKNSISKKVTHVLAGDDAGPAKMSKAQELGIKIINEDEFLEMIKNQGKKPSRNSLEIKKDVKKEKSPTRKTPKKSSSEKVDKKERDKSQDKDRSKNNKDKEHNSIKIEDKESKNHVKPKSDEKPRSPRKDKIDKKLEVKTESKVDVVELVKAKTAPVSGIPSLTSTNKLEVKIESKVDAAIEPKLVKAKTAPVSRIPSLTSTNTIMWVEKHKPQTVKQIIGQHGDASNVKKLMNWLTKWYVNRKAKLPKPSPWAKNDDGGYFKAVLLSGPPGVGKTTTVSLVCKELGFDMVEFNASDTRNKTLIKEQIGELLTTTSLSAYAKGSTGKQAVTKKHVLVMDEVDGMAGNEDRGGLQELIALIKSTSVPIICMCNDRASQKMRSLVNYCYDLRFNRPRVEQIKSAMMSICCKEGVKIPPDALTQLIVASNQDVRQTLNLLSMWAIEPALADSERLKADAGNKKKDLKLGPWEAVRKVFSAEEHKSMTINDKSDLFFYDYSLAPLFVHENYLQVTPHCPKNEILDRIATAADSITVGDLVDARIRGSQAWNLLPYQAMFSSVIPGTVLSGHVSGQINFPSWLGNNSKRNKMHRLCQEIHAHTRLSTSGSKSSIFLDYAPHLRDSILNPLLKEKADGIDKSLEILESYHLLREDLDSLIDLSLWSGQRNPMILIDSKIKAAMTRTYNKKALALPYAPGAVKKSRVKETDGEDEEYIDDDEEQDSDPENDALIKKKKTKDEKPSTSKDKASTSKATASSSKTSTLKEKSNSRKKK